MTAADDLEQPAETTPARGYTWPPFEPGHTLSTKHGAYSPRLVEPRTHEIVDEIAPTVTWWTPADRPAVIAWARCEARIELILEWLAGRTDDSNAGGLLDADGEIRGAAALLVKLESAAANHRARLGLDPLSRARLKRDTAAAEVDVAQLLAQLAQTDAAAAAAAELEERNDQEVDDDDQ